MPIPALTITKSFDTYLSQNSVDRDLPSSGEIFNPTSDPRFLKQQEHNDVVQNLGLLTDAIELLG